MANEPTIVDAGAVWRSQSAQPFRLSAADVSAGVARFERRTRRRYVFASAIAVFELIAFVACFIAFSGTFQRLGAILTMAAMSFLIIQLRFQSARMSSTSINVMKVVRPTIEFYRDDIERLRAFHRGRWFWSRFAALVPGPLIFLYGFAADYPNLAVFIAIEAAAFVLVLLVSIWLQYRIARRYERRLSELTRLEETPR